MNKCLFFGYFPEIWKKGLVIFFRKRNKSPDNIRAYRPITLLPVLGKLLEKILKTRIMVYLESINFFDNGQHGFREGCSTSSALRALKVNIDNIRKNFKYTALISLDIQGAFDNISWCIIYDVINETPLPLYMKNILKSYLHNRSIGINLNDMFTWHKINKGCPQGSCLGPLLWLLVADRVLKRYRQCGGSVISYADDFIILVEGNTRTGLEQVATSRLEFFDSICADFRLPLSVDKTRAMMLGTNLLENRRPQFKLKNVNIKFERNIEYLGFTLDEKFNFYTHFDTVREKIINFTSGFRSFSSYGKGLQNEITKIWYKVVREKQILYGHDAWGDFINSHTKRRIFSCQRQGLLSVAKTYRSVSTDALCTITGIPPILITLENEYKVYGVLNGLEEILIENETISKTNLSTKIKTYDFPNFKQLNNLFIIEDLKTHGDTNDFDVVVYTDGSRMSNGTASAFVAYVNDQEVNTCQIKLCKFNSIFQAELTAINYDTK